MPLLDQNGEPMGAVTVVLKRFRTQTKKNAINRGRAVMERTGDFSTTMVFEKGRRFDGAYRTPWGELAMGIYTVQVNASFGEEQASLRLVYQVDIQGRFTAMHDLTLRLAPNE